MIDKLSLKTKFTNLKPTSFRDKLQYRNFMTKICYHGRFPKSSFGPATKHTICIRGTRMTPPTFTIETPEIRAMEAPRGLAYTMRMLYDENNRSLEWGHVDISGVLPDV